MCIMPIALPPAANYCFFDGANEPKAKTENGGRVCLPPPMSLQRPDAVPASAMKSAKQLPKILFCFCDFWLRMKSFLSSHHRIYYTIFSAA